MPRFARLALLGAATLSLTACFDKTPDETLSTLCIYNTDAQAQRCKAGQTAWFRPENGQPVSEQTALSVAAAYCDFGQQIMHNRAGLVCVFTDQRLSSVQ